MHWTLGVLVGLPIAGFLILACLVAAAIAVRLVARDHKQSRYGNHWTDYLIVTPWLIGALVIPVLHPLRHGVPPVAPRGGHRAADR